MRREADVVEGTEASPRPLRARRVWPGSRAVTGGLLVAVAALALFVAAQRSTADHERYVVAVADIAPGQHITPADLGLQEADLPTTLAAHLYRVDVADHIVGSVARTPIRSGELIHRSDVAPSADSPNHRELSFSVARARAINGRLRAGDTIDVITTIGTGSSATTSRVVAGLLVLSVDQPSGGYLASEHIVVTVGLADGDGVLELVAALDSGSVTLIRNRSAAHL